jgi:ribosome-interacting GTPase 1
MAVNLTPQYLEAEEEYRRAQTAQERLDCLRKMWTLLPKHKASEKLQAELKAKISEAREAVEQEKKKPKSGGVSYKIPKQGAGQVVIVGAPNAGKSRLLASVTRATPEVAPYAFTTREPTAGMMDYADVRIQLIDTPPITADVLEPFVTNLVAAADAAILCVDAGDDDGPFAAEAVIEKLASVKVQLTRQRPAEPPAVGIRSVPTLLVATKCDAEGASDRLEIIREMFAARFPIVEIAAEANLHLDRFRQATFELLRVMRIYTKEPGKPADKAAPFTCPIGSTVAEFAGCIHRELAEKVKSARVWGTGVVDGQTVSREHVLHDGDLVELHT